MPKIIKKQCSLTKLLQKQEGAIFLPHSVFPATEAEFTKKQSR